MDLQRSNPHFKLSPDPRQPQVADEPAASDVSAANPAFEQPVEKTTPIDFLPAPPVVPEATVPVIESMQVVPVPVPTAQSVETIATPIESHVIPHEVKPIVRNGVPKKFVVAGALVMLILLVGSMVIQQMAISELKNERRVLGEQVKQVNPISVGAGASENQED